MAIFKSILVRSGQPNYTYRKILLTGKFNGVSFPNRLKLDYEEIALLNAGQESSPNAPLNMFDSKECSKMKMTKHFDKEYRLHIEVDKDSRVYT